jgi:RimJ/RimL family protein N-acetyltransferase
MNHPQTLLTERLRLRPLVTDDAPFFLQLVNDPGWRRFIGDRNLHTLEAAEDSIRQGPQASYAEHGFGLMLVERREDATPLGICGLLQRPTLPGPDLGFAMLGVHAGHGFTSEAGAAALASAWDEHGLDAVLAITDPDNAASIRVLEKLGFVPAPPTGDHRPEISSRMFRCVRPADRP